MTNTLAVRAILVLCALLLTLARANAHAQHEYSIILVNSFNESDFEVRLMYQLMNEIANDENILLLTVPPYYADAADTLEDEVKENIQKNFRYQLRSLVHTLDQEHFKRIIAIGRHASTFLDDNHALLPQAERFFLHIDWTPKKGVAVPSDYDPVSSFKQITGAFPEAKEVIFVYGSLDLSVDQGLVANFLSQAPKGIRVRYFNPMQYPQETLTALQQLSAQTPILYINYKYFERNWETVHHWLVEQKTHPIFTIFAHNVDRYAGGAVVVPEKLATLAISIARGASPSTTENLAVSLQFNAQQLSQWGIDTSALPKDATLVNHTPAVLTLQSVFFIVSVLLSIIVLLAIFTLYRAKLHAEKMRVALQRADSANQSKSAFLANMSHEIRTPMNGVLGALQVLDRMTTERASKALLDKAIYSAHSLLTIINDILDYSKIEANKLTLERQPFSIRVVLDSVFSDMCPAAQRKGILLSIDCQEEGSQGWLGDEVRVKQILLNLVSNAVKFTEKGLVTVHVSVEAMSDNLDQLCLRVVDTGIGMNAEAKQKIFERFSQADASTTRRFGGTGLGMSITLSLVRLMNGLIEIESSEGRGTDIMVKLPLERTLLPPVAQQHPRTEAPRLSGMRILIAEDNDINQMIISSMLEPTGADITTVDNGQKALDAVTQQDFDLVLMDIQMPVMDGIEACTRIKHYRQHLPIVALTADVMTDEVAHYAQVGFSAYISKPIDINKLYLSLRAFYAGD